MKHKAICISNKEEYVERFNLWQTYEYKTGTKGSFNLKTKERIDSPKLYWVYLDEGEFIELFEEDFDANFIDRAIYRETRIKEILK